MAGLKEIKRRISSIQSTKKTTYAMKLVSAAKLRRVQEVVSASSIYYYELYRMLENILIDIKKQPDLFAAIFEDKESPLIQHGVFRLSPENAGKTLVLVIGGNRGLSGPYNSSINKKCSKIIRDEGLTNDNSDWIVIGKKPNDYLQKLGLNVLEKYLGLPEDTENWPIAEITAKVLSLFKDVYNRAFVVYTKFNSALSMEATSEQILPFTPDLLNDGMELDSPFKVLKNPVEDVKPDIETQFSRKYEPSIADFLNVLLAKLLDLRIFNFCNHSKASEHASRMTAMDTATKNAGELYDGLKLQYNKIRQSTITAELLDIIGGANAIS